MTLEMKWRKPDSSNSVLDTVEQCDEDCDKIEEENIQDSSVFS